ncbi:tetratricopeptide repeat protein [Streptomyces sp. NPDC058067]|uniref:serine/threonine protein kinase n=1 Tax=Streptomyces sp. NPDC058067 TaxID=3346324 RepID=UPI0036F0DD3A
MTRSSGPLFVMPSPDRPRDARVTLPEEGPDPTALPEVRPRDDRGRAAGPGEPALEQGELLAGQYRVVRRLGQGGMGDVYLALDTKIDDREVAVKTLRPGQLAPRLGSLEDERQAFADLHHDGIIAVFNYGRHTRVGPFLVLPYVDGLNLDEIRALAAHDPDRFGGSRFHEFVLAYGLRVLSALDHLHARPAPRKVYGDLKPPNVMHDGATTKVIDVGSIREEGAPGLTTDGFRAPNVPLAPPALAGASTPRDDLFSLGETLRTLSGLGAGTHALAELGALDRLRAGDPVTAEAAARTTTPAPEGLGLVSLARALRRATRPEPADRYADADEMADQLRGVFRELRSLRTGQETFEPSPLFEQSPYALDGALGVAPVLPRWATPTGDAGAGAAGSGDATSGDALPGHVPLGPLHEPPSPADAAARLPAPRPDPHDAHHDRLSRLADADPAALLQHTGDWRDSPEVRLLRCRLRLRVAVRADRAAGEPPDLKSAAAELDGAVAGIGPELSPHDWRIDWHRGLLILAEGDVASARDYFDQVYGAIPGEYAPKLALGHCAERLGHWHEALTFYEAVRLRNPSLGSAAFGAARARLALGGTSPDTYAIDALDAVPQHSRHRTPARTATVRIAVEYATTADGLRTALTRLARLFNEHGLTDEQARVRMKAEVWEAAQRLVTRRSVDTADLVRLSEAARRRDEDARDAGGRLEFPSEQVELRRQLSQFYRALARQAARSDSPHGEAVAERLLDRAYLVRPLELWHRRDRPRPPRLLPRLPGTRPSGADR